MFIWHLGALFVYNCHSNVKTCLLFQEKRYNLYILSLFPINVDVYMSIMSNVDVYMSIMSNFDVYMSIMSNIHIICENLT